MEQEAIAVPGRSVGIEATFHTVSERYFETIGLPIVAGSGFDRNHLANGTRVAVVNTTFIDRVWPGVYPASAIGRRFKTMPGGQRLRVLPSS